jgi:hypothetical protein
MNKLKGKLGPIARPPPPPFAVGEMVSADDGRYAQLVHRGQRSRRAAAERERAGRATRAARDAAAWKPFSAHDPAAAWRKPIADRVAGLKRKQERAAYRKAAAAAGRRTSGWRIPKGKHAERVRRTREKLGKGYTARRARSRRRRRRTRRKTRRGRKKRRKHGGVTYYNPLYKGPTRESHTDVEADTTAAAHNPRRSTLMKKQQKAAPTKTRKNSAKKANHAPPRYVKVKVQGVKYAASFNAYGKVYGIFDYHSVRKALKKGTPPILLGHLQPRGEHGPARGRIKKLTWVSAAAAAAHRRRRGGASRRAAWTQRGGHIFD